MAAEPVRRRSPSEVLRRGYSDEEVAHIYELGRFFLENGDLRRSELIMTGLTEVAPDFHPAWLGKAYVHLMSGDTDSALQAASHALRVQPESTEAMLYLVTCLLTVKDYNAAGTQLGEIGERIDGGLVDNPNLVRLYRAQLVRYQAR